MKRILSFILIAALIASVFAAFSLNTGAEDVDIADEGANNKLIITCRKQVIGEVEVGNEFIYNVALNSGGISVVAGEGQLRYNDTYASIVEYGDVRSDGSINMNAYSFPTRIRNTNLVTNYFEQKNIAYYNFTKFSGVGAFTEDDHFFKIRMKALKPGAVEIRHYAKCFYARSGSSDVKLIYDDFGNSQLDPIPYTVCSIEPSVGLVGDADGDYELTVMDATYVQRITAGAALTYSELGADSDGNGTVNLLDSMNILRCKAGKQTKGKVGEWIFESEQE